MTRIAGIDPGRDGAIVVLQDGLIYKYTLLRACIPKLYLLDHGVRTVYIEKAQPMGRESSKAMFNYGMAYGYMLGTLSGSGFDINFVPPQAWTGALHKKAPMTFSNPKEASLYVARQLWPDQNFLATERSRVPHDGVVDAALIAYYGGVYVKERKSCAGFRQE